MNNTYITTTIPYVNSKPHVGFALELVQADAINRFQQLLGNTTRFQTGTDDNAFKNVVSAREQGVPTRAFVDQNADAFRELADRLQIQYDSFIRTSGPQHRSGVERFWRRLKQDDLYTDTYEGLYCVGCEDFVLTTNLVEGLCPDHQTRPETICETNLFFRLSSYQRQLEELVESGTLEIVPEKCRNEVLSFIRQGLRDISISRSAERSDGWGIPVPGCPDQVIYVWIDALINYISGLGDKQGDFWDADSQKVHVIGKNVWKFHAVYWPALLISAGLPVPDKIVVHGFLTVNGEKISKSLGNGVDPVPLIHEYGADALRYYLLRYFSPFHDGDFTVEQLKTAYNADLANGLGNLVSRLLTLAEKCEIRSFREPCDQALPAGYVAAFAGFEYNNALKFLWDKIDQINQGIDREKPWIAIKEGDSHKAEALVRKWLGDLAGLAFALSPFLPETSGKLSALLNAEPLKACKPLFPRIR